MLQTFFTYDRVVTFLAHALCLLLVLAVIVAILAVVAFVGLLLDLFWTNPGYFLLCLVGAFFFGKVVSRDPSF